MLDRFLLSLRTKLLMKLNSFSLINVRSYRKKVKIIMFAYRFSGQLKGSSVVIFVLMYD